MALGSDFLIGVPYRNDQVLHGGIWKESFPRKKKKELSNMVAGFEKTICKEESKVGDRSRRNSFIQEQLIMV